MRNQRFSIAICDDEQMDRDEIVRMTKEICEREQLQAELSCFANAEELQRAVEREGGFDLLFMDVMMPGKTGMDLARILRKDGQEVPIVFISSSRDMALQGYEVAASRYLAKPVQESYLREALLFCLEQQQKKAGLLIPVCGVMRRIDAADICYLEINGRKTRVVEREGTLETSLSLDELEHMLEGQGFLRIHKSFLVNCSQIHTLSASAVVLTDGRELPVSKHRSKEVRTAFFQYMNH